MDTSSSTPPGPALRSALLRELKWRGLFHQATDEAALDAHLVSGPPAARRGYVGFDPTAPSLTIGNLVPIMMLVHLQRAGHSPVVVTGGATGLIGDPSGKSEERQLRTRDEVEANVAAQRRIFESLLDFSPRLPNRAVMTDNISWTGELSFLDALRDVGKHFSVNAMIQRDSVRERLHNRDQGISYTEFSYMILQAYDFLHLRRKLGVTLQMGGSDQWGNIVAGVDLIRRVYAQEGKPDEGHAFAVTAPLVTKADGGKFGKTESGAVWLTADRTSPYAYYQFWLNAADADLPRFLRTFTLLSADEIGALEAAHAADPGKREAHRALARAATDLLHGVAAREQAEAAARALFTGELDGLSAPMLDEVLAGAPTTAHARSSLEGDGVPLVELLAQTSLADSKGTAKRVLAEGSVSVNGRKAAPDARLTTADLLHGRVIALRRGKKSWHITRWE